ncbi:hypothetical protein D3C81_1335170 [compost metagenome]
MVSTMCFTPSSSTAARATSASCCGVLCATVRPAASDCPIEQNLQVFFRLSYRMQVCSTVVASTSAPCSVAIWEYGTPSSVCIA